MAGDNSWSAPVIAGTELRRLVADLRSRRHKRAGASRRSGGRFRFRDNGRVYAAWYGMCSGEGSSVSRMIHDKSEDSRPTVSCAWCFRVLHSGTADVSHGICEECLARVGMRNEERPRNRAEGA